MTASVACLPDPGLEPHPRRRDGDADTDASLPTSPAAGALASGAVAGNTYGLVTWNLAAGVLFAVVASASLAAQDYAERRHPEVMAAYRRAAWQAALVIVVLGLAGFALFVVERWSG